MPTRNNKSLGFALSLILALTGAALAQAAPVDNSGFFSGFGWRDLNEVLAIVGASAAVIGAPLWMWLRWKLSAEFASKADVNALSERMQAVENEIKRLPDAHDLATLSERVSEVDKSVAVAVEQTRGVKELMLRVDHSVKLLMEHHVVKQPVTIIERERSR